MDSKFKLINQFFSDLIESVINLVPDLLLSLVVLIIGLILAWVMQKLIRRFILYLHRNINEKLRNRFLAVDLQSSAKFISRTFFWIIIILTIAIVTQILGLSMLTGWFSGLINYLPNILAAIVIVFIGIIAGKLAGDLTSSAVSQTGVSYGKQLGKLVRVIIIFVSIILAIEQIGIDILFLTNTIIIILAALLFGASLAFGLGARTSVSNILGSYYLQKTYKVGNTIRIGEIEGVIVKITPTAAFLETKTGQVMIPAKEFNEVKTILIKKK